MDPTRHLPTELGRLQLQGHRAARLPAERVPVREAPKQRSRPLADNRLGRPGHFVQRGQFQQERHQLQAEVRVRGLHADEKGGQGAQPTQEH